MKRRDHFFYDYERDLEGEYEHANLTAADILPDSSTKEAGERLARYMADVSKAVEAKNWWLSRATDLALLIGTGREYYVHGKYLGDPVPNPDIDEAVRYKGLLVKADKISHASKMDHSNVLGSEVLDHAKFRPRTDKKSDDDFVPHPDSHLGVLDWWRITAPQGTIDRPYEHDFVAGDPEYQHIWDQDFEKPQLTDSQKGQYQRRLASVGKEPKWVQENRKVPGRYGVLNNGLGDFPHRQIGWVPFIPVFSLVQTWWLSNRPSKFRPDFNHAGSRHDFRQSKIDIPPRAKTWVTTIDTDALNEAAHFWTAFCGQIDYRLDLDDVRPDQALWRWLEVEFGLRGSRQMPKGQYAPLDYDDMVALETARIFRIAGRCYLNVREHLRRT